MAGHVQGIFYITLVTAECVALGYATFDAFSDTESSLLQFEFRVMIDL